LEPELAQKGALAELFGNSQNELFPLGVDFFNGQRKGAGDCIGTGNLNFEPRAFAEFILKGL
jgi:hypothetical protein